MKLNKYGKLSATVLSVVMLQYATFGIIPSVAAQELQKSDEFVSGMDDSAIVEDDLSLDNLPDSLATSLAEELGNATRLDEEIYYDLFSIGTINDDGTKSFLTFNYPVKYYDDETESIRFIDNVFTKIDSGNDLLYVNKGNGYHVSLPENITEGLNFTYDKYSMDMRPLSVVGNEKPILTNNELQYDRVFDDFTAVSYSLENAGIKESIFVSEPNGVTTYDFVFSSNGLIPTETSGNTITFIDESTGEAVYIIQPTYIVDSYNGEYVDGEEHITYNNYYEVENLSEDSYLIHMNLDEEFLSADSTVYPCVIDPSIWAAKFTDDSSSYVMQSGGSGYVNSQLSAGGFNGSGEHLSYVKPNSVDKLKWIEPSRLKSASFNVKAASSGYSNDCTINLYDSTTNSAVSAITYSELTSSLGTLQSSATFTTLGASYSFDVTALFRQWISYALGEGGKDPAYGFRNEIISLTHEQKEIVYVCYDPDGSNAYFQTLLSESGEIK